MVADVALGIGVGGIGVFVGGGVLVGVGRNVLVGIFVAVGALRVNSAERVETNCVASKSGPPPGKLQAVSQTLIQTRMTNRW
jgi:hypothetical protein